MIRHYTKNYNKPLPENLDENLKTKIKKKIIKYFTTNFDEPLPENLDEHLKTQIEKSRHDLIYYTINYGEPHKLDSNFKKKILEVRDLIKQVEIYLENETLKCSFEKYTNIQQIEQLLKNFKEILSNEEHKKYVDKLIQNIVKDIILYGYSKNGYKTTYDWSYTLNSDDFKKVIELIELYIYKQLKTNQPIINDIACLHKGMVYKHPQYRTDWTELFQSRPDDDFSYNKIRGGRKSRKRSDQIKKKKRRTRTTRF